MLRFRYCIEICLFAYCFARPYNSPIFFRRKRPAMSCFVVFYAILRDRLFCRINAHHLRPSSRPGYHRACSSLARIVFPGGGHMNMIGEFAKRIIDELARFIDWSLSHWAVTMIVLVTMIYWAGKQRRVNRHHP
jgi:hypothetical protein